MSQTRTGPKDVFGVGLAHQVGLALGDYEVTRTELNQIVANPLVAQRVAAAIKGQAAPAVTLDALVTREQRFTHDFCLLAQIEYPGDAVIEKAFKKIKTLSHQDRFVPASVGLPEGFQFHYSWNANRKDEGLQGLKLYYEAQPEWWRTDTKVEHLPTVAGVIRCNFATVMEWADLEGRPFNLDRDEQVKWGTQQGGDGITTAEQNVYLNARSLMERGLPLISLGSLRCKNRYGSGGSLDVYCHADGFDVGHWSDGGEYWYVGALPGKFVALGS